MKFLSRKRAAAHYTLITLREIYLILQAVFMLFPLVYLVLCSAKTSSAIAQSPFSLPDSFGVIVDNFRQALTGQIMLPGNIAIQMYTPFVTMLKNTVVLVVIALLFLVVCATPMGYVLGTRRFRGKNAVMFYVLFIQTVPLFGYLTAFYVLMDAIGFTNDLFAIGIIYAGVSMPSTILFMKGFYASFPKEVEEAAEIDGAGEFRRFMMIVVPMSKGIVISMILVQFMGYWNEFAIVNLLVSEQNLRTISINVMLTSSSVYMTYTFALLVLSAVPTFVFFTVFQKRITQGGLSLGSIKG